jgi:BirA family biotin operon repressor/biotin-[acetyl-CoA-carboxylase] ligase
LGFLLDLGHNRDIRRETKKRTALRGKGPATRVHALLTSAGPRTDGRLGRLIRLLAGHPTIVLSGTKVAQEMGTTRSEVWRLVQQLRAAGVEITGHPASGYQLRRVPDLLLPEIVDPLVGRTIFAGNINHYFRIGSTNDAALTAAAEGAPHGGVFVAEEQTRGRGRGGHSWTSERAAGIYCSIVLRPQLPPADVLLLSLAAALGAAAAIEEITALKPDLRWPNDLLLEGKKVCGILAEMNAEATRVRHVVLGVGINVNQTAFPEPLRDAATSLRLASGRTWSRVELFAALLKSLDRVYQSFSAADSAAARASLLRRFEERSSYARGRNVHVDENGGYSGTTEGLDERGFLRVRAGSELRTVRAGGVRALDQS